MRGRVEPRILGLTGEAKVKGTAATLLKGRLQISTIGSGLRFKSLASKSLRQYYLEKSTTIGETNFL